MAPPSPSKKPCKIASREVVKWQHGGPADGSRLDVAPLGVLKGGADVRRHFLLLEPTNRRVLDRKNKVSSLYPAQQGTGLTGDSTGKRKVS